MSVWSLCHKATEMSCIYHASDYQLERPRLWLCVPHWPDTIISTCCTVNFPYTTEAPPASHDLQSAVTIIRFLCCAQQQCEARWCHSSCFRWVIRRFLNLHAAVRWKPSASHSLFSLNHSRNIWSYSTMTLSHMHWIILACCCFCHRRVLTFA